MNTHRQTWKILGACTLAAAAAACGSSGTPASSTSTTPAATTPAASPSATSGASSPTTAGTAAIVTNWEAFFSAKTPVAKRVTLLQDGSQFQSIIKGQAGSGLAATASAKVLKVTNVTASQATVKYNILVSGATALPNQTGTAVLQNGTWKVGVASFCGLLHLEGLKSIPAVCMSAG
jgi:hypothetical protein